MADEDKAGAGLSFAWSGKSAQNMEQTTTMGGNFGDMPITIGAGNPISATVTNKYVWVIGACVAVALIVAAAVHFSHKRKGA